ncbi:MAG: class III poly(R)-hydroxyalkanoic acid synthase subunit PhaC [Proteobacteria bacterium]|nr:MAG: class III poly(R)-hydroxyalkanoic acid synthase subunit PhaC [Pseudomonadota bacterium]
MTAAGAHSSPENPTASYIEESVEWLQAAAAPWSPSPSRCLVADFGLCQLYRYPALVDTDTSTSTIAARNVLFIVYAMVNTASILDLRDKLSIIQRLQWLGLTIYLMEWVPPQSSQSNIGLAEYLEQSLHRCVEKACQDSAADRLNLMGVCQGGVFSLCYAAMYPERVRSLVPVVTPINFHTENDTLSRWVRYVPLDELMVSGMNIPGQMLAQVFIMLKPMSLSVKKYLDIAKRSRQGTEDAEIAETFMAMEQWIHNTPDQPAACFKDFVEKFYQQNALYHSSLHLAGRAVDLRQPNIPTLNIYAKNDHLVPPESSKALQELIPAHCYHSLEIPTGHIGMFVSQKSLNYVPQAIADFIRQV